MTCGSSIPLGRSTATAPVTRYFRGLRLHLVCTLIGLPVLFALAGAKADERETLLDMPEAGQDVVNAHLGQTLIGDKNYFGRAFEDRKSTRLNSSHMSI